MVGFCPGVAEPEALVRKGGSWKPFGLVSVEVAGQAECSLSSLAGKSLCLEIPTPSPAPHTLICPRTGY